MTNVKTVPILVLIAFLFVVSSHTVSAQLAQEAYAIFEKSCFSCHGSGAPFAAILLIEDHSALIKEGGAVVPGDSDASRLYKRLLAEGGALMPLGGPPLPDAEIENGQKLDLSRRTRLGDVSSQCNSRSFPDTNSPR